eukprot:TRINITY_DN3884_c3_g1_i1.p1 TRINITY_DN3884_c3_g1~~TRINITY_DN3884_c3_g1_i1.p1  ORF type:complete len:593 (+),score=92.22 TRINITY_DN3884_c3_g1_i1:501-2279(+)
MPLRHYKGDLEKEKANYKKILTSILPKIETLTEDHRKVVDRFRTATTRRYQSLQDIRNVADGILEREEFTPSADVLDKLPREPIVRSIARFLINRGPLMNDGVTCVSLSGGVDSMVIAHALCHLRDHPKPVHRAGKGQLTSTADRRVKHNAVEKDSVGLVKTIVAVHINYGNREAAQHEADFLVDWCQRRNILLKVKNIDDLKRASGDVSRDEYEAITRNIRYDEYRRVIAENKVTGICLGHHSGDVIENVLSNANRGSGILDLSGMTEVGKMEDVSTWRPLLPHNKTEIFNYAHLYGVPYFLDTTPSWSTRGKLRNNLLPCLTDTYGAGTGQNLHSLALESDALKTLIYDHMISPFLNSNLKKHSLGVEISYLSHKSHGKVFWKELMKVVQHSIFNTSMLSESALVELSVRLGLTGFEANDASYILKAQDGWLEPKKGMYWYSENGKLYIPKLDVFAKESETVIQKSAEEMLPIAGTVDLGSWRITASPYVIREGEEGDERYSDHRSLPVPCKSPPWQSYDEFLSGSFSYYLAVPPSAQYLVWQSHPEALPPLPWKRIHSRFHQSVPIACSVDKVTSDDIRVVKVDVQYIK